MCGIAGLFGKNKIEVDDLKKMINKLKHRGPDGDGLVLFSEKNSFPVVGAETAHNIINTNFNYTPNSERIFDSNIADGGFAHRRLSIIDLEASGHQPMCSIDKRYWITFNGELYNYTEIKNKLIDLGYPFVSNSDTEVVLYSFVHFKEKCLDLFNGMWAFSIYDTQEKIIFSARDRFGVKPFYYSLNRDFFAFASEQKALNATDKFETRINENAVFDFFVFNKIENEETGFFENIHELFPGHYLTFNINSWEIKTRKWYELKFSQLREKFDLKKYEQAVSEVNSLFEDAIRIRLRSDVPVGACLSGGIDSSAIVGMMRKILPQENINVYTASFPNESIDETRFAEIVAKHNNVNQFFIYPKAENLIKELVDLTVCQDIPIWSTSTYAQYSVLKKVKETGIKVVLDGQGGDEIFGGYAQHNSFFWKGLNWSDFAAAIKKNGGKSALTFHLKQQLIYNHQNKLPGSVKSMVYKNYFKDLLFLNNDFFENNISRFNHSNKISSNLNQKLADEMQNTSLKSYLKCEDRCAMWHGIEARTPFADDHKLIEAVFNLPEVYKIGFGNNKQLLRDATKNILPPEIFNRKDKLGYATPNNKWLNEISSSFFDNFNEDISPYLNVQLLKKNYKNFFSPKSNHDNGRIFKYLSFAIWINEVKKNNIN